MSDILLKKIAFFVEGKTEMVFLEKLLFEVCSVNSYAYKIQTMRGGGKNVYQVEVIREQVLSPEMHKFILITECGSDSTVKSYMLEERVSLIKSGYSLIVGIVDLYPRPLTELYKWIKGLNYLVPQLPIPLKFVIPVVEIESWFIAEKNHFLKINPRLTTDRISEVIGYRYENLIVENIGHPSVTLDGIYRTENIRYKKTEASIKRTVEALDYVNIYFELRTFIPSLNDLIKIINEDVLGITH